MIERRSVTTHGDGAGVVREKAEAAPSVGLPLPSSGASLVSFER